MSRQAWHGKRPCNNESWSSRSVSLAKPTVDEWYEKRDESEERVDVDYLALGSCCGEPFRVHAADAVKAIFHGLASGGASRQCIAAAAAATIRTCRDVPTDAPAKGDLDARSIELDIHEQLKAISEQFLGPGVGIASVCKRLRSGHYLDLAAQISNQHRRRKSVVHPSAELPQRLRSALASMAQSSTWPTPYEGREAKDYVHQADQPYEVMVDGLRSLEYKLDSLSQRLDDATAGLVVIANQKLQELDRVLSAPSTPGLNVTQWPDMPPPTPPPLAPAPYFTLPSVGPVLRPPGIKQHATPGLLRCGKEKFSDVELGELAKLFDEKFATLADKMASITHSLSVPGFRPAPKD